MFVRNRPPIPVTGGLSDTILKDSTGTQFIARDDSGVFSYVTLDGASYVPVPPITALFVAGVSTAAKQDDQSLILDEIRSGLIPVSTAAKQDSLQTLMTSMASAVATAAKQDSQIALETALNGLVATASGQAAQSTILTAIHTDEATAVNQGSQITLAMALNALITSLNGLVATSAKQDTLAGLVATAANQTTLQTAVSKEAKQDALNALITTLNGMVSTAARQDSMISLQSSLNTTVSTAAKQDTLAALITTLNGLVATAANQVTANGFLTSIADQNTFKVMMDYRMAAALGHIAGARTLILAGNSKNIQTAQIPLLLWDANITYPWQSAAVAMEVVSDNANDTAGGTGARAIMVTMVDGLYNETTYVLPMNGTTGVAIPSTNLTLNRFDVVSSGSNHNNIGTLRVRPVATPSQTIGFIGPNFGSMHAALITVPAGKKLQVDNFYIDTLSGNKTVNLNIQLCVRLQDGTVQVRQENSAFSSNTPNNALFLTPFTLPEKTTLFIQITSADQNGANIAISAGAVISNA